jgi:hypothetical protein
MSKYLGSFTQEEFLAYIRGETGQSQISTLIAYARAQYSMVR